MNHFLFSTPSLSSPGSPLSSFSTYPFIVSICSHSSTITSFILNSTSYSLWSVFCTLAPLSGSETELAWLTSYSRITDFLKVTKLVIGRLGVQDCSICFQSPSPSTTLHYMNSLGLLLSPDPLSICFELTWCIRNCKRPSPCLQRTHRLVREISSQFNYFITAMTEACIHCKITSTA